MGIDMNLVHQEVEHNLLYRVELQKPYDVVAKGTKGWLIQCNKNNLMFTLDEPAPIDNAFSLHSIIGRNSKSENVTFITRRKLLAMTKRIEATDEDRINYIVKQLESNFIMSEGLTDRKLDSDKIKSMLTSLANKKDYTRLNNYVSLLMKDITSRTEDVLPIVTK